MPSDAPSDQTHEPIPTASCTSRYSEDGEIEMPFDRQFWGDYFGSLTDKFGIRWMVTARDPEAEQPAP